LSLIGHEVSSNPFKASTANRLQGELIMATQSVTINNQSAHSAHLMVFQQNPGSLSADAMALAWFSKFSDPGSNVEFGWDLTWGFSWADTGALQAGITYNVNGTTDSQPTSNQITLDFNGAYQLTKPDRGPDPDLLYIVQDTTIPVASTASVGVTMNGSTVYAVQATPNTNLTFTPHPSYFLAYGDYTPGLVLDLSSINNPLKLVYGPGVSGLQVTLNADNTWGPITTGS
jgi:hypothetical protein